MKPLIGISCGTFYDRDWCPPSFGHRQTYVDAILRAVNPDKAERLISEIDDRFDRGQPSA